MPWVRLMASASAAGRGFEVLVIWFQVLEPGPGSIQLVQHCPDRFYVYLHHSRQRIKALGQSSVRS